MFSFYIPSSKTTRSFSLGLIVVTSVALTKYGYLISLLGLTIAALVAVLSYTSAWTKRTILSTWLHFFKQVTHICIAANGLSVLLDYMNGNKHSYIHLVPTSTMPHLLPITIIVVITILFILGLEANHILDSLLKTSLVLALIVFILTSMMLVHFPENGVLNIPDDIILQVFSSAAFFCSCFDYNRTKIDVNTLLGNLLKFTLYAIFVIILFFIPKAECVMICIVCPLSHWYKWYEPTMVCIALSSLCLTLPQVFSPALDTLILSGQFNIKILSKENSTTGTHVRAISIIGLICSVLLYLHPTHDLIILSSCCILLGQSFDSFLQINQQFQPLFTPKNHVLSKKKSNSYILLKESINISKEYQEDRTDLVSCFSDDSGQSSETDIDSVVTEYKDSVKVKACNFKKGNSEPTLLSGRIATILISLIVIGSILSSTAFMKKYYSIAACLLLGTLVLACLLQTQPWLGEHTDVKRLSFLGQIVYNCLIVVLLSTIIVDVGITLILWVVGGVLCATYYSSGKGKKGMKPQIKLQSPPGPFVITDVFPVQRTLNDRVL